MQLAPSLLPACETWIRLLAVNQLSVAWRIIGSEAAFSSFSRTQYQQALSWLVKIGALVRLDNSLAVRAGLQERLGDDLRTILAAEALGASPPLWLPRADDLDFHDPPLDARAIQEALSLSDEALAIAVWRAAAKVDVRRREEVGLAGERALLDWLSTRGVAAVHVSASDDSAGYDISAKHDSEYWHLEVKSSTAPRFRKVHLSRNECRVAEVDRAWILVLVELSRSLELVGVATVREPDLRGRMPRDRSARGRWTSAELTLEDWQVQSGLWLGSQAVM